MTPTRTLALCTAIASLLSPAAYAATYTLAPLAYQTVLDVNGNPVSGAKICTYLAGTTTPTATFSDSIGTQNANPIRADSSGRFVVYLLPGASYKFVFQDATGTAGTCDGVAIRTQDNITAVPPASGNVDVTGTAGEALTAGQVVYLSDGGAGKTAGQWFKADNANTYSSTLPEIGFAVASVTSGSSGTIRVGGSVTGLSSLTIGAEYYIGTAGAITSTAPANQRNVGKADTTSTLCACPNQARVMFAGTSTITTTGTATALAIPSGMGNLVIYANNATGLTVQGIAPGLDGQKLTIYSIGSGQVDLVHQNGSAPAANRLINFATVAATSLAAGTGVAELVYDAAFTRWRLTSHEQGAPIAFTPTVQFGGANVGQTYSVQTAVYFLRGRTVYIAGRLTMTAKGSSTGAATVIGLPIAVANTVFYFGAATIPFYAGMATLVNTLTGYITPGSTTISLQTGGAAATAAVTDVNFTNASDFIFNAMYEVA